MKTRFAFAGFRHAHILDLLAGVNERGDATVIACCEEDAAARASLSVNITHTDFSKMLAEVECDVIAIGDYYSRRGSLAIAALQAGRHVLSDKPLCTSLEEQTTIERLAAERGLLVGLQLDCRDYAAFRTLREIIVAGEIGEVATVRIQGQHPLLPGTRPAWYFEPGKHGGTLNDIGIHAFDFVPWLTGQGWRKVDAVRTWNAKARDFPHFHDAAQLMATLENGAGVLADFSYLAPDRLGYKLPHYWHVLIHGTHGLAEAHLQAEHVTVITDGGAIPEIRPVLEKRSRGYLDDFLRELAGKPAGLTSADCLGASRLALEAESLARHREPASVTSPSRSAR